MAWIKFEKDLLTDPRVLRIARTLQSRWSLYEEIASANGLGCCNAQALPAVTLVCGALVRIWCLADTHLDESDVLPLGIDELDEVVGIPGFCELLPFDWLQSLDEHSVKLPEFHAHNGTEAKKRAVTQKRVARLRTRNAPALQRVTHQALPDQTRPDQNIKNKNTATQSAQKLVALGVDEQAAKDWLAVRKAKRAPLTDTAIKSLQREAEKAGISVAEAVLICAKRSWQGFNAGWNWCDDEPKNGKPVTAPWWSSDATILAKGRELQLNPRPGESMNEFKGRINVAMGACEAQR